MSRFLIVTILIGTILLSATGCQFNRQFAPITPGHVFSNELGRRGIVAKEQGDLAEAERQLEDAVKWNKNNINHRLNFAEVLWKQGRHQESLYQLNEAVKRGGQDDASLHISLAEKYLEIREYTIAERHANEAVRLAPQNHRSWALRGQARYMRATLRPGDPSEQSLATLREAREDYIRAVSLAPNNSTDSTLLMGLANVQMRCGQPEQALATWLTAQRLYQQGNEPYEILVGKMETLAMLQRFNEAETTLATIRQRGLEIPGMEQRLQETMIATRRQ